jgi:hypothetical protein
MRYYADAADVAVVTVVVVVGRVHAAAGDYAFEIVLFFLVGIVADVAAVAFVVVVVVVFVVAVVVFVAAAVSEDNVRYYCYRSLVSSMVSTMLLPLDNRSFGIKEKKKLRPLNPIRKTECDNLIYTN